MTNIAVIENKISSIKKYLTILKRYQDLSVKEIEESIDIKGAVERYLYLAIQATINLAEAMISFKNLRKPATMSEAFDILKEEKIISNELNEKMVKMTGFRNIIAHDYEKTDYEIVYNVLHSGMKDVDDFIKQIAKIF